MPSGRPTEPERYEPLPSLGEMPRWIWRKTSRRLRIAAGLVLLAGIALGIALAPGIRESKEERADAERRERAELRVERIGELRAEQRPRFARSASVAPPGASRERRLAARVQVFDELSATMLADARRRVRRGTLDGRILRTECEPFPRTVAGVGAHEDLSRRRGRYSCIAVTAEFERGQASVGGVIGHPYRALVDFESGRYAFCKISGRAGEFSVDPKPLVTTPRACGGR